MKLADELQTTLAQTKQLSELEKMVLRRAQLGIGGCHMDNEEFEDALKIFDKLQKNHRKTIESFHASAFIVDIVHKMVAQPMQKDLAVRLQAQAVESVRLAKEDMTAPEDLVFRGNPSQRAAWLRWADEAEISLKRLLRDDSGLPNFR